MPNPILAVVDRWLRLRVERIVAIVVLALLSVPQTAEAQRPAGVARIGVLESSSPTSFPDRLDALRRGLAVQGYVEGRTVVFEYRWANGKVADLAKLADELVGLKVDLLVAGTTAAAQAAKAATHTIPIVFAVPADPVGSGLVASLSRPGGNVTGLSTANVEVAPKRLELLKLATAGKASRTAVLFNPADISNVLGVSSAQQAARRLGMSLRQIPVGSVEDFEPAFAALAAEGVDSLLVAAGALTDSHPRMLAELAARSRIPAVYGARGFVDAGGLMSYSANFADNYRRAATYVDKILRGAKPADLPVEQASTFELVVNLKAAQALGLRMPTSVVQRADVVIE